MRKKKLCRMGRSASLMLAVILAVSPVMNALAEENGIAADRSAEAGRSDETDGHEEIISIEDANHTMASYEDEEGEWEEVYIDSVEDMKAFARNCWLDTWSVNKKVYLMSDLDLSGSDFVSIPTFGGYFNGQGHTVSGLQIRDSLSYTGLFCYTQESAVIANLKVKGNVHPAGKAMVVGGIVGDNRGIVINCTFEGNVEGNDYVGGVTGFNEQSGILIDCSCIGKVTGAHYTGGIAGENVGNIAGCVNEADVNTSNEDKGMSLEDINLEQYTIGLLDVDHDGEKPDKAPAVNNTIDSGGIAGLSTGIIQYCSNSGMIGYEHVGYNTGGIVGRQSGYVYACENTGTVYGRRDVGGIAGQTEPYIAVDLSEDIAYQLSESIDELHDLTDRMLDDAGAESDTVSARLTVIQDFVNKALDDTNFLADRTIEWTDGMIGSANDVMGRLDYIMDETGKEGGFIDQTRNAAGDVRDAARELGSTVDALDIYSYMSTEEKAQYEAAKAGMESASTQYAEDYADALSAYRNYYIDKVRSDPANDYIRSSGFSLYVSIDDFSDGKSGNRAGDGAGGNSAGYSGADFGKRTGVNTTDNAIGSTDAVNTGSEPGANKDNPENGTGGSPEAGNPGNRPGTDTDADYPGNGSGGSTDADNAGNGSDGNIDADNAGNRPGGSTDADNSDNGSGGNTDDNNSGDEPGGNNTGDNPGEGTDGDNTDYGTTGGDSSDAGNGMSSIITDSSGDDAESDDDLDESDDDADDDMDTRDTGDASEKDLRPCFGNEVAAGWTGWKADYTFRDYIGVTGWVHYNDLDQSQTAFPQRDGEQGELDRKLLADAAREMSEIGNAVKIEADAASYADEKYIAAHPSSSGYKQDMRDYLKTMTETVVKAASKMSEEARIRLESAVGYVEDAMGSLESAGSEVRNIFSTVNGMPDIQLPQLGGDYRSKANSLNSNLQGLSDNMGHLNEEMSSTNDVMLEDLSDINDQFSKIMRLYTDAIDGVLDMDYSTVYEDNSQEDAATSTDATIAGCTNKGIVRGDLNVSGIAGTMAIEYDFDLEGDVTGIENARWNSTFLTKCVLRENINEGNITAQKNYAGGISGLQEMGTVLRCENYGRISVTAGNYAGGIAGQSLSHITDSYSKCTVSGEEYVAGIAGSGSSMENCCVMVRIQDASAFYGAIAGETDNSGSVSGNYFVSDEIAGIDRISYSGKAEPVSYEQLLAMEGLPSRFRMMRVTFYADEEEVKRVECPYGGNVLPDWYPDIPAKDGFYADWDIREINNIMYDEDVTAEYVRYLTTLASEQTRENGQSVLLADGMFKQEEVLQVSGGSIAYSTDSAGKSGTPDETGNQTKAEEQNGVTDDSEAESSSVNETEQDNSTAATGELLVGGIELEGTKAADADSETDHAAKDIPLKNVTEYWQITVPEDGSKQHQLRYQAPQGQTEGIRIFTYQDGEWKQVDTELMGIYHLFTIDGTEAEIAVCVQESNFAAYLIYIIPAAVLLLIVTLFLVRKKRRRKKLAAGKTKKESAEEEDLQEEQPDEEAN